MDIDDDILNQFLDDFEQENGLKKKSELEPQVDGNPTSQHVDIAKEENQPKIKFETETQITEKPEPKHLEVLSKYFGHKSFRPMQWEIISAIISDRRDVCAIMSTGYGKSLCFQFPSIFLGGITLVISPLISLMEDQVLSLKVSNIPACLLGTAQKQQKQVVDDIFNLKYSLVYLTPEFCSGDYGMNILTKMTKELNVVLIAIDEAHCISSWGHDFRFQYRNLGMLRRTFTAVPIIAVTATATGRVREDIVKSLNLRNPLLVCTGFDRPNIYFEVNEKSSMVYRDLTKVMVNEGSGYRFSGPTIIYCITRKETVEVAKILTTYGIKCLPYHAGLKLEAREEAHELFVKDKIDVIVGTIAFGMGIDKPDVRNVIHYGCSKSLENYYQEVGRSGRDGLPSSCVTFYNGADLKVLRCLNSRSGDVAKNENSLKKMEEFLITSKCRRRFILEYFEDNVDHLDKPRRSCCDNCTKRLYDTRTDHDKYEGVDEQGRYDFTADANTFLRAIDAYKAAKLGLGTYILFLRGSASSRIPESKRRLPEYGIGKNQSEAWWQAIARLLMQEKLLVERTERTTAGFSYVSVSITEKGRGMLYSNQKLIVPPTTTILKLLKPKSVQSGMWVSTSRPAATIPSTSKKIVPEKVESETDLLERMELYRKLLDERAEIAAFLDCMPYMVASNTVLMTLSKLRPSTLEEIRRLNLDGFAEAKINKFGNKFLRIINGNSGQSVDGRILSIADALKLHPLPQASINVSAEVTCRMFQSGLTVEEIAQKREVTRGTIVNHLVIGMRVGEPVKMEKLGITKELRDGIVKVIRHFDLATVKLTQIKERCPPEITYDEIKVVVTYLRVRIHLRSHNIQYEEFEDFSFSEVYEKKPPNLAVDQNSFHEEETQFVPWDERKEVPEAQMNKIKNDSNTDIEASLDEEVAEVPAKKIKIDSETDIEADLDAIFGTPFEADTEKTDSQLNEAAPSKVNQGGGSGKSKKKVLPPWLIVKKIN